MIALGLTLGLRDLTQMEAERAAKAVTMTPPTRSTPQMRRLMEVTLSFTGLE